jgi:hypothetical protein
MATGGVFDIRRLDNDADGYDGRISNKSIHG